MTIRDHPDVRAFKDSAARFCQLLEARPTDPDLWAEEILEALARLYGCAHTLPFFELPDDAPDLPDELYVSYEESSRVLSLVQDVLGAQISYREYYDPSEPPDWERHVPTTGHLGDDLADIYGDVKPALRAWETGADEYLHSLVFEWKCPLFVTHWGVHAVSAMRALHPIAFFFGVKMPEVIDPEELGIVGPVTQDCRHCGAPWNLGTDKPLQRCPSCWRWRVPFWKRRLPRWLVWMFVAMAGPAMAYFVVRIIQLYLFP